MTHFTIQADFFLKYKMVSPVTLLANHEHIYSQI